MTPGARIYLLNVETLESRILPYPSSTCAVALGPAFSPVGDQIASYCADHSFNVGAIYIQSTHGDLTRKFQRLHGAFAGLPSPPNTKFIVYLLNRFIHRS